MVHYNYRIHKEHYQTHIFFKVKHCYSNITDYSEGLTVDVTTVPFWNAFSVLYGVHNINFVNLVDIITYSPFMQSHPV